MRDNIVGDAIGAARNLKIAAAASHAIAAYVLHTAWVFSWRVLIETLAGALLTMLVFGYAGLTAAARTRPAQLLRNE